MLNVYNKFTKSFKTNYLAVDFVLPLQKETAAKISLLSQVLTRGCQKYGEMEQIAARLEELYGAELSIRSERLSETQTLSFCITFLDHQYLLEKENITQDIVDLLCSVMLEPICEGGAFRADFIEQEKKNLCDRIEAVINDKRRYAMLRCRQLMCGDEAYGVFELGDRDAVNAIDGAQLYEFYQSILASACVFVTYIGAENDIGAGVAQKISELRFGEGMPLTKTKICNKVGKTRFFEEKFSLSQSKLCLGFRMGEAAQQNFEAMQLFNVVYGGSPTSKLFMNVRERLSLCYYCSSVIDPLKNVMFVSSGIAEENFDAAKDEILRQLDLVCKGEISQEEFENAKMYLLDTMRSARDSQLRLCAQYLQDFMRGDTTSIEEKISKIEQVTVEQVRAIARDVRLDTIYLMRGEGGQQGNA